MGVVSTAIYSARNAGKGVNGESARFIVSADQAVNAILNESGKAVNTVDDFANSIFKVTNASTRLAEITSKAVNPLLVTAAGIRVLKDDDKKSALVEEGLAMGTMFGAEKLYKMARNTVRENLEDAATLGKTKVAKNINKKAGKTFKNKTVVGYAQDISEYLNKITKGSKGKKKALLILAEILAVGVSILSYDTGKKIGKKLTGRDEATQKTASTNPFNG